MSIQELLPLGIGTLLASNKNLKLFTPKARSEDAKMYSASLGSSKTKLTTSTNVFEEFEEKRISSWEDLATLTTPDAKDPKINHPDIKTPDGSSLLDKLTPPPGEELSENQQATIDALNQAFAFSDTTNNGIFRAKKDFEDAITDLNSAIKKNPAKYDMAAIASYLQTLRKTAEEGIKNQHQKEKEAINRLFTDDDKLAAIKASMGLSTQKQIDTFKRDLLKSTEKSHKEQLDAFNKTTGDEIEALHKAANQRRDEINTLSILYRNAVNKKIIDELAAKYRAANPENNATSVEKDYEDFEPGLATFKGVNTSDMSHIKSPSGLDIQYDKKNKSYSVSLPKFGFLYYNERNQNIDDDFTASASLVKNDGADAIEMTVDYNDQDYAMELGRRQYEAACRVGFDPSQIDDPKDPKVKICHIKVIVNGKHVPTDELFKGCEHRKNTANETAKNYKPHAIAYDKSSNIHKESDTVLKHDVNEQREERLNPPPLAT